MTTACSWCGRLHSRRNRASGGGKRNSDTGAAQCCSKKCAEAYAIHGHGPSQRQVEMRRAHRLSQPKGARTVEEWLALGGEPYTEPAVPHYASPRPDRISFGGRV